MIRESSQLTADMTMCPAPDPTEGPPHAAQPPLARNRAVVVALVVGVLAPVW